MNAMRSQKLPKCIVLQVSCEGRSVVTEGAPSHQVSGTLCPYSNGSVTQTERKDPLLDTATQTTHHRSLPSLFRQT